MQKIKERKASSILVFIWLVLHALAHRTDIELLLCGKGINVIGIEYWRFLTAGFVQTNPIHTLGNVYLISWLGMKYDTMCLYYIQRIVTETTLVRNTLVGKEWIMVKNIPELHDLLSFDQLEGKVEFTLFDVSLQSDISNITSDETVNTEDVLASTTSTRISEGNEDSDSEGNNDFHIL